MTAMPYRLDRKITIQHNVGVADPDYGTIVASWTAFASRIWSEAQDVLPSRSEDAKNGIKVAAQPTRFIIRNRPGITSDMRIVLHGATDRTFQITAGPAEIQGRRFIEMMGIEYSTSGDA